MNEALLVTSAVQTLYSILHGQPIIDTIGAYVKVIFCKHAGSLRRRERKRETQAGALQTVGASASARRVR